MNRNIITRKDADAYSAAVKARAGSDIAAAAWEGARTTGADPPKPDDYKDRLFKYIPADVIALYLTLDGILTTAAPADDLPLNQLRWFIVVLVLVLTPFYLRRVAKVVKKQQIAISTAAFLVWTIYLGGPFNTIPGYHSVYGALLFVVFTFVVPVWEVEA